MKLKLPKLKLRKGPYLGMRGCNEVHGAPYYFVPDVDAYMEKANEILIYAKHLEDTLQRYDQLKRHE